MKWVRLSTCLLALTGLLSARAAAQSGDTGRPGQEQATQEVLSLMQQAMKLQGEKRVAEAVPLMERAVALSEKALGESFPLALSLDLLGGLHLQLNDLDRAEPYLTRALSVREHVQGPEHPDVASTLTSLASIASKREQFDRAEQLYLRALAINEKAHGPADASVGVTLYGLSATYSNRGLYARAEPLLRRALAIFEKAGGEQGEYFAVLALNNLASVLEQQGRYEEAEPLYLRSLAAQERIFGAEGETVATTLTNLAALYRKKGEYLRAEPLLRRALAAQEKTLGPAHADVGITLNQLALLLSDRGDDADALPLFERALSIYEKTLGPENSAVAATLSSIASIYNERREYDRAEELYRRALSIVEKTLGQETPLYASTLNSLANTVAEREDYARAEPLARRALEIRERVLGPDHPDVALTLNTLAYLSFVRQRFSEEEPLYRRAIEITEKAQGREHPSVGTYLANLATVYWGRGDTARALETLTRLAELRERNLALLLSTGSEEQKRLYMETLANETEGILSFHTRAAPSDAAAAELALTTLLRRKGRVLDVVSDQISALRRRLDPRDRALLDRLSAARAALARLVLEGGAADGPLEERRAGRARLEAEVGRLEAEVSTRSAEFRTEARAVTVGDVRAALPADAALVELATFRPYDPRAKTRRERFGPARYAAYVLKREGAPRWVDLGEAAPLEREVEAWRRALTNPSSADVRERGRAVDELVMHPVRRLLGETRHVFLSPDGVLNLVPFGALLDENGRFLVEDYSITYLTSGRDLLRLQAVAESRGEPVVIADPSFDGAAAGGGPTRPEQDAPNRRAAGMAGASFPALPGTKGEANALGALLPNVRVLTGAQATESALKSLHAPAVLHVATHGFFLPGEGGAGAGDFGELETRGLAVTRHKAEGENPLLRSGLALAGANRRQGGAGEDGILTAFEAAGLDLWGTKLVVLSACETGVGDVRKGDGVYGLRRALVLAGAQSQVMSLWQVDDAATRDLMVAYYRRLQAGEGRTEALRAVQLEMLKGASAPPGTGKRPNRSHPFFWASFIQSGDWREMVSSRQ
ncbi:MAG: CHAT domain-containing protein [Acidobacteria bacterium]|nr:CHAT domain-containing protein [Acidobacteriota bacterium]